MRPLLAVGAHVSGEQVALGAGVVTVVTHVCLAAGALGPAVARAARYLTHSIDTLHKTNTENSCNFV